MIYYPENFIKHLLFFNKIINFADGIRNLVETYQLHHKNKQYVIAASQEGRMKNE